MGTASAAQIENFEANYPMVQSVAGEAPVKGFALSPNHPSWPQLPAVQNSGSNKPMETVRGKIIDASQQHYLA